MRTLPIGNINPYSNRGWKVDPERCLAAYQASGGYCFVCFLVLGVCVYGKTSPNDLEMEII